MKKLALSYLIVIGILSSANVQALSVAPSYSCCEDWAAAGSRPHTCEPNQTVEICEEQLNNPQPDYFVGCWPFSDNPECRARIDANIEKLREERQKNPIDLDGSEVSELNTAKTSLVIAMALATIVTTTLLIRQRRK